MASAVAACPGPGSAAAVRGPATQIYDSTGVPGEHVYVDTPALAYDADSDRVLATWGVSTDTWGTLRARVLDSSGRPVGDTITLPGFDWAGDPSVTAAGHGRFVVGGLTWSFADGCGLHGLSTIAVTADGVVGERHDIAAPAPGCAYDGPDLAADPTTGRVEAVWFRSQGHGMAGVALGRLLGTAGEPIGPLRVLMGQTAHTDHADGYASVAYAPGLRAWVLAVARSESRHLGCFRHDVLTRLLGPAGVPRGPSHVVAARPCGSEGPPLVTWDASTRRGLLVYHQERPFASGVVVRALPLDERVERAGPAHRVSVLADTQPVSAGATALVALPDGGALLGYVRYCDPGSPSGASLCDDRSPGVVQRLDRRGRRQGPATVVAHDAATLTAAGTGLLLGWRRFTGFDEPKRVLVAPLAP